MSAGNGKNCELKMEKKLLEEYLQGLYGMYDEFEQDYRTLHKRSKMHNSETIGEYYMRWKTKLREEIRKTEKELVCLAQNPIGALNSVMR